MNLGMDKLIKKELDNYLGFDFNDIVAVTDFATVFGGALRDIIAGDAENINDIDIVALPKSASNIVGVLASNGYINMGDLVKQDIAITYGELGFFREVMTFVSAVDFGKRVQIIVPRSTLRSREEGRDVGDNIYKGFIENYNYILHNVDLSCCALAFRHELISIYEHAILHSRAKVYRQMEGSAMANSRLPNRCAKLNIRGWIDVDNPIDKHDCALRIKSAMRDLRMEMVSDSGEYEIENILLKALSKYENNEVDTPDLLDELPF